MEELMHTSGLNILHPDDREIAVSMHRAMVSENITMDGLFRFQCKNGRWITLETRGKSLVKSGKIVGVVTVGRDVTERVRMEQELKEYQDQLKFLAFHDPLTGLPNRTLFFDQTTQALEDATRDQWRLAMVFIDCDDFKRINDVYGHEAGDEVVKEVGQRILVSIRSNDTVARVGGDEFTVLLPHIQSQEDVVEVVHRVLQSTSSGWEKNGYEFGLTVSIGVAVFPSDGMDARTLMRHADEALYDAKQHGKNTYMFYGSSRKA
jgi:diguanylate cyclase (GGDEF)-like protein